MKTQDTVASMFEDMLTTMAVADRADWNVPDMNFFDGAIIGLVDVVDFMAESMEAAYGRFSKNHDHVFNTHRSVKGSVITPETKPGDRYLLSGSRELNFHERQRIAPLLSTHIPVILGAFDSRIVETRSVMLRNDGKAITKERNHYYQNKGRWYPARPPKDYDRETQYSALGFNMAAYTSALTRILWSVRVRIAPQFPSLGLFTDPVGVREFFKLRDIPEGSNRRRALVHWVSEHFRQTRDDPETESYVREHLRGDRTFSWGGLSGEILIPETDEQRILNGIEKRKRLTETDGVRRLRRLRL